jgi:hypothetical protein
MGRVSLFFLFLFSFCSSSYAQSFIFNGPSHHSVGQHNNLNYGVSYKTDRNLIFGAFQNSEYRASAHLSYEVQLADSFSIVVGGATGYSGRAVSLVFLPTYRITLDPFAILISSTPFYDTTLNKVGLLFHLMLEFKIK